ncbi:MAG: FAD-dependent oxidoreductase [Akkermansiaceae bacterium]
MASGTTWHSVGQVGQLRASSAQTKVNKASTEILASLLEDTGHDPGWLQCGGLQLASSDERLYQLQRAAMPR